MAFCTDIKKVFSDALQPLSGFLKASFLILRRNEAKIVQFQNCTWCIRILLFDLSIVLAVTTDL